MNNTITRATTKKNTKRDNQETLQINQNAIFEAYGWLSWLSKHPTLGLGAGHDVRVMQSSPSFAQLCSL